MNHLAVTTNKVINGLFPFLLRDIFQNTSQVHSRELRGSGINLFIPRPLSEAGERSFQYQGATLRNNLPIHTRNQASTLTFIKAFLPA